MIRLASQAQQSVSLVQKTFFGFNEGILLLPVVEFGSSHSETQNILVDDDEESQVRARDGSVPRHDMARLGQGSLHAQPETGLSSHDREAQDELRCWLRDVARVPGSRISGLIDTLKEHWVDDVDTLRSNLDVLEKHIPAAAYAAIAKAVEVESGAAAEKTSDAPGNDPSLRKSSAVGNTLGKTPKARAPRGLVCKFVWEERRFDITLTQEDLDRAASVQSLVSDLAKRGEHPCSTTNWTAALVTVTR